MLYKINLYVIPSRFRISYGNYQVALFERTQYYEREQFKLRWHITGSTFSGERFRTFAIPSLKVWWQEYLFVSSRDGNVMSRAYSVQCVGVLLGVALTSLLPKRVPFLWVVSVHATCIMVPLHSTCTTVVWRFQYLCTVLLFALHVNSKCPANISEIV